MSEEESTKSTTKEWSWVDPDLVEIEGPYQCPHCGFHIGIDSTYLNQASKIVVCPNCETEASVPDHVRAKGLTSTARIDMMVWCQSCGPGIQISPLLTKPDTSVKSARLVLDQTIRAHIPGQDRIIEVPGSAETICTKCKARHPVTDKLAINMLMEMLGVDNISDMFRGIQKCTSEDTGDQ